MILITSLSSSIEKMPQQVRALHSWTDMGFEVVSFNEESEIVDIREQGVYEEFNIYYEFSPTRLVRVRSIFERYKNLEFCYTNADIEFKNDRAYWDRVKEYIEKHNSLLYICRYNYDEYREDVDHRTFLEMEKFGLDTFFVPKNFYTNIAEVIPDYLYIGKPLWDYFIPFISVMRTIRIDLKYSHEELTYHKRHQKRWNSQEWVEIAMKLKRDFPELKTDRLRQFSTNMRGIFISRANILEL